MVIIFVLIAILSSPVFALSATIYIDPTCTNNGDGTVGSPCAASGGGAGPKNTWVGLTWTAGNTYAGKGGTSQTLANFLVAGSGSNGSPITITSYGSGQFTFFSSTTYALAIVNRNYITWDNVAFQSTATHCLYLSSGTNLIIQNSSFTTCGPNGVATSAILLEQATTNNFDNITISNNQFTSLAGMAVLGNLDATSSQNWDSISITNNTVTNAGLQATAPAFDFQAVKGTTGSFSNLTISGNSISSSNRGYASPAPLIRATRTVTTDAQEDRFTGIRIINNTLANSGGGIFVSHVGLQAGVQNCVCNNTLSFLNTNAGIAPWATVGLIVEGNSISGITPGSTGIDGMGIDAENNLSARPTNLVIRKNVIFNNFGGTGNPTGEGIYIWGSANVDVYGNLLYSNHTGMLIDGGGSAGTNYISNNTIANSTQDGILASFSVTQQSVFVNNIIYGSVRYGISDLGVSDQTLTRNIFFSNAGGNYNSISAGATDILQDPLLDSAYKLQNTSPARGAGIISTAICMDVRGRSCKSSPDIGAYQMSSGDPSASRTSAITRTRPSSRSAIATARSAR